MVVVEMALVAGTGGMYHNQLGITRKVGPLLQVPSVKQQKSKLSYLLTGIFGSTVNFSALGLANPILPLCFETTVLD